ncbi:Ammonium transporter 1 member 3 [Auxenochlorella protothecoides]|uniref:Ammonium transporter 1 member 3 n=1 Tax=Auxenochlorella protothecoides TaxID=3075 RepID=A0A087SLU3_AUXPR|nr:Ammonium transporter 1 member 3 [Auxenochlorella protothecoides]KFM26697.1 Ammonium transporter 1 member 3 [Auxenochlorella protothecoides]
MAGANSLGEVAQNLATLNNTIQQELADLTIGAIPGYTDINAGWTLQSGYLVFFMQAGFAMLCAGAVRAKNAKNIILLNLLDACLGSMCWYITGFAFAFGDPTAADDGTYAWYSPFIGHRFFAMNQLPRTSYVTWFFQFTFAATGATIVSGAVAERCRFESYLLYEMMLVSLVYPVVAHWVWSPFGWLSAGRNTATVSGSYLLFSGSGVYDFAGDGPVHMVGGFASLAGAWILGPRLGRFDAAGNPIDMPGHNASLNLLGVFTWAAIIIGLFAGGVYIIASRVNLNLLKIDDPLDAIAVHAGCAVWGMIAGAAFADLGMVEDYYGASPYGEDTTREYGFIMGGGGKLLGAHLVYIICIAAWVLGIMGPYFFILKRLGIFRVSPEVETAGLDASYHGGHAYPHEVTGKGQAYKNEAFDKEENGLTAAKVQMQIDMALGKLKEELTHPSDKSE